MKVIKTQIITKLVEVNYCQECPYYGEIQDMNARIPTCSLLWDKNNVWANTLSISPYERKIDKKCPLKNNADG